MSSGAAPLRNSFQKAVPVLRSLRGKAEQTRSGLQSFTERVTSAADSLERLKTPAGQSATAVQKLKTNADAAAKSVAKTGQTATTARSGVKSAGGKAKSAGKSLGKLKSGLGGVFAIVGALIAASGVLGGLLDAFGTAMTIGSAVMLLINVLTRANPIGFVTGILLPVAGWLLDLAMNSETGQRLMELLATLMLKYVEGILTALAPVLKVVGSVVNTYVTGYLHVITGVLTVLSTVIGTGFAVLKALTTGDTRALSGKVSAVWHGFKEAVRPVLNWIAKDIPGMFQRVKDATSSTLSAMGQFLSTGAQTVAGVVKGPIQGLIAFANWIIDGLNSLSFSFFGKKFGVHLDKIPMLAAGGIVIPAARSGAGRVLPLTALDRQRALFARRRAASTAAARRHNHVEEFHERHGTGAFGTAQDLLFLASVHARP